MKGELDKKEKKQKKSKEDAMERDDDLAQYNLDDYDEEQPASGMPPAKPAYLSSDAISKVPTFLVTSRDCHTTPIMPKIHILHCMMSAIRKCAFKTHC